MIKEWRCVTPNQKWAGLTYNPTLKKTPDVIAVHGWLDNAASFLPLIKQLQREQSKLHFLAIDLPGHGKSAWRRGQLAYDYPEWIALFAELLNTQKWKPSTLLGHSLGGSIVLLHAALYPKQQKRLMLVDAYGPVLKPTSQTVQTFKSYVDDVQRASRANRKRALSFTQWTALRTKSPLSPLSAVSASTLMKRATRRDGDSGLYTLRTDPRLKVASAYRIHIEQTKALLKQVQCPTLVLRNAGTASDTYWQKYRPCMKQHKGLQVIDMPGGHHLHMENTAVIERMAELLHSFRWL